jgi:hypothetical protein
VGTSGDRLKITFGSHWNKEQENLLI